MKDKNMNKIWNWFYTKGTINFGNGHFDAKKNKITGKVSLMLSNDIMAQLFSEKLIQTPDKTDS